MHTHKREARRIDTYESIQVRLMYSSGQTFQLIYDVDELFFVESDGSATARIVHQNRRTNNYFVQH